MNTLGSRLLLFAAAFLAPQHAAAVLITQSGLPVSPISVGDSVTLTYELNNIGEPGIVVLGFDVRYDDSVLAWNESQSAIQNGILSGDLQEGSAPVSPDYAGIASCCFSLLDDMDPIEVILGWSGGLAASWVESSAAPLGTVVFDAIAPGVSDISAVFGQGATMAHDAGTYLSQGLSYVDNSDLLFFAGNGSVTVVPEPTTALLVGGGIAAFALHRRTRR